MVTSLSLFLSRKRAISTFSEAVRLCKTEMSDSDRLAYWQERYIQYRKAATKHVSRANTRFLGPPPTSSIPLSVASS